MGGLDVRSWRIGHRVRCPGVATVSAEAPPQAPLRGQFLNDLELAEALAHHLPALEQERQWCGNFRAEPRIVNALAQLRTAIDILRTQHHT